VADEVEAWQAGRQWQSMHVVGKPNYTVRHIGREFPPSLKKLTISFPNGCEIACSKSVFGMDNELYRYITETFL